MSRRDTSLFLYTPRRHAGAHRRTKRGTLIIDYSDDLWLVTPRAKSTDCCFRHQASASALPRTSSGERVSPESPISRDWPSDLRLWTIKHAIPITGVWTESALHGFDVGICCWSHSWIPKTISVLLLIWQWTLDDVLSSLNLRPKIQNNFFIIRSARFSLPSMCSLK